MVAHNFGSLIFTPTIKALQERHGSRRQYARMEGSGASHNGLRPQALAAEEKEFLADRDSFYVASIGSTGWPYVQHRGGPAGFNAPSLRDNTHRPARTPPATPPRVRSRSVSISGVLHTRGAEWTQRSGSSMPGCSSARGGSLLVVMSRIVTLACRPAS